MKTLEQIKNDYAVSEGFEDWWHLDFHTSDWDLLNNHWKNICVIAQKECLKLASDNVISNENYININGIDVLNEFSVKESITNENNLIK